MFVFFLFFFYNPKTGIAWNFNQWDCICNQIEIMAVKERLEFLQMRNVSLCFYSPLTWCQLFDRKEHCFHGRESSVRTRKETRNGRNV